MPLSLQLRGPLFRLMILKADLKGEILRDKCCLKTIEILSKTKTNTFSGGVAEC
jgi:hypothetical protein